MDLGKISAGRDPPRDLHAVIEIPLGGVVRWLDADGAERLVIEALERARTNGAKGIS